MSSYSGKTMFGAMQIVIPMSGFGERFRQAGYSVPKPLIEIDGKPIIAHVIDMFPGEQEFIFICNNEHLQNSDYHMREILHKYCPTGKIVGIAPHKLGPVHAVLQVEHLIDPSRPVVVNYCDFTCYWDWQHFKKFVASTKCQGAIPAYKGFHPHTLGNTNYAYLQETGGWVQDIQEKKPYTENRMQEYASSGTYYFATGKLMSAAFGAAVAQKLMLGGEYYVSLAYKILLAEQLPVAVYPLQHFMQWGTPEDVQEYRVWSETFRALTQTSKPESKSSGSLIVPMAGLGQRFAEAGYSVTKPLIPVSGKFMVVQAVSELPQTHHHCFVLRSDMPGFENITKTLEEIYPSAVIKTLSNVTEGQACTTMIGLDAMTDKLGNDLGPLTVGACDFGALYDEKKFQGMLEDPAIDIIVWGTCGHPSAIRNPKMFGWIDADEKGLIKAISVKKPLQSPGTDPIVLGTFTFKKAEDCRKIINSLIARNGRVNGEFYLDSCINDAIDLGLKCHLFKVDHLMSWGTPNDLQTFEYWQGCFHKWASHPYRLSKDSRVPADAVRTLETKYQAITPMEPL